MVLAEDFTIHYYRNIHSIVLTIVLIIQKKRKNVYREAQSVKLQRKRTILTFQV